jgi:hypothetical protein
MKTRLACACIALVLLATPALARKRQEPQRPSWVIHSGGRVFQRAWMGKPSGGLSDSEKKRIAAQAKAKLGAEAMFITENPVSPISANNVVLIDPDRDCAKAPAADYCRSMDSVVNQARGLLQDCQLIEPGVISTLPWKQIGIDRGCVERHARSALDLATARLSQGRLDRNIDWIAGALKLLSECRPPLLARDYAYCDAFDVDTRLSFLADLLEDLKTHPRPLKEIVTSRMVFGTDSVDLGERNPAAGTFLMVASGEFMNYRVRPGDMPGRIIVKFPDQANAFAMPDSLSLEQIATDSLRSKCATQGGTLLESPEDEAPRIGFLDIGSEVAVFYIGSCRVSKR